MVDEREIARFRAKFDTPVEGCWIWKGKRRSNYGRFRSGGKWVSAHRFAYQISFEDFDPSLCVLHRCDVPACVRPDHLFQGTQLENIADCVSKGRTARGDASGARKHPERVARGDASSARKHPNAFPKGSQRRNAKLTEGDVLYILGLPKEVDNGTISQHLGIDRSIVSRIRNRKAWKHVEGEKK